jgi:hypothetical protein
MHILSSNTVVGLGRNANRISVAMLHILILPISFFLHFYLFFNEAVLSTVT